MTNKKHFPGALSRVTVGLVLALVWAICMSVISIAAEKPEAFDQTLEVAQSVEGNANRTKYTYRLTPKADGCPLLEGAKDGVYEFTLDGNDVAKLKLAFPADAAANFQYELTRVEKTPAGDTVTPESHLFGYLIQQDADGNWVIIPYTCYDGHMEIWNKTDADGNPLGMTLSNEIVGTKGDKGDKGDPGQDGKDGQDGQKGDKGDAGTDGKDGANGTNGTNGTDGTDGKNGTNGTNGRNGTNGKDGVTTTNVVTRTVNKIVNTGDPYQVGLWLGLIVLSGGALITLLIVRRKKDNDEETM